ncbi:DNA methyltransferase [Chryseobacterium bernardetii]|uniref:DNA methyltransferase n=1 Tax=Chryseobacterium bernardetii TaxID=1241978 RepID=UPI001623C82F|nr:DNA methyltransferase [Chryseobacterium bernardetii]
MKITEKITITNEDNMELMARYPDNYFDLAIVDPPYGIGVNISIGRRKGDKKSDYHKFAGNDKEIPTKDYFTQLFRVSKNQIIWGGNYMTNYLNPTPCWLLWDKGFSSDVTFAQYELAWASFSTSAKKFDYNAALNKNRIHPTQKPVALYKWILDKYAKSGDKILDTHLGSGSIAIACHDYGFELTACELDTDYYNASIERIKRHVAFNQSLFSPEQLNPQNTLFQ